MTSRRKFLGRGISTLGTAGLAGALAADPSALGAKAAVDGGHIVRSRAELTAKGLGGPRHAYITEQGRAGLFLFDASDLSSAVAEDPDQAIHIPPSEDASGKGGAWVRQYDGPLDIRWFGAKGDGRADDSEAFASAVRTAPDGSAIMMPEGTFKVTRDIIWSAARRLTLVGRGQSSTLELVGCSLKLTGAAGVNRPIIEKLRLYRRGKAGAALHIDGSTNLGVSRWVVRELTIESQSGTGLLIEGSWIGTLDSVVFTRCDIGVDISRDAELGKTSSNALTVIGGEVQGCNEGWRIAASMGTAMFGHAIEGCRRGITAHDGARNLTLNTCYFEHNTQYDLSLGGVANGYCYAIRDCMFFSPGGGASTDYAIVLRSGKNIAVEGNSFIGYNVAGVRVRDEVGTATTGVVRRSYLSSTPAEADIEAKAFGDLRTIRQSEYAATSDANARTQFNPFAVPVPGDTCGRATFTMRFRLQSGRGDVMVGYTAVTSTGAVIGSGSTTVRNAQPGVLIEASLVRDITAQAGANIIVNFQRYGDKAADSHSGQLEFLGGEVAMRTSTPDA